MRKVAVALSVLSLTACEALNIAGTRPVDPASSGGPTVSAVEQIHYSFACRDDPPTESCEVVCYGDDTPFPKYRSVSTASVVVVGRGAEAHNILANIVVASGPNVREVNLVATGDAGCELSNMVLQPRE
jgi:hypothetical protein